MKWLAERPPHWVWDGDKWHRIPDNKVFVADVNSKKWIAIDETIPFPKDCKIEEPIQPINLNLDPF